jgi:hypothetical protein
VASLNSLLFTVALALAPVSSGEPPSSVDPPELAKLHVSYTHVLTQACTAERKGKGLVCRSQTVPLPATTTFTLVPVPVRLPLNAKSDRRKPLAVNVDAENPADRDLPAGRWRVVWPGYQAEPSFTASVGQTVELKLSLVEGRCEPGPSECRVVSGALSRHAELVNVR